MEQFILQVKNNIQAQNSQNKLFDERLRESEKHLEKSKAFFVLRIKERQDDIPRAVHDGGVSPLHPGALRGLRTLRDLLRGRRPPGHPAG